MPADTTHPSFPQPNDQNTPIWRYMSFERFRLMIESRRLYVPSANDLGDPLEGSVPGGELAVWNDHLAQAQTKEAVSIIDHNRVLTGHAVRQWRDASYVSCWNLGQHESYTMWRAYAPSADSVVIRSTYAKLRDALPDYVHLGRVRYVDYRMAKFEGQWNALNHIMHKDVFYRHEDEVRAVLNALRVISEGKGDEDIGMVEDSETHKRAYKPAVDFTHLLDGIVLHPDVTTDVAREITSFCQDRNLPRPVGSRALLRARF